METIEIQELKAKIDRGDDFKLVMTMGDWAFESQHIIGSLNISAPDQALKTLKKNDEIIVYCSGPSCIAGQTSYHLLRAEGYENVRRFSGGLSEWSEAGYPLEGSEILSNVVDCITAYPPDFPNAEAFSFCISPSINFLPAIAKRMVLEPLSLSQVF